MNKCRLFYFPRLKGFNMTSWRIDQEDSAYSLVMNTLEVLDSLEYVAHRHFSYKPLFVDLPAWTRESITNMNNPWIFDSIQNLSYGDQEEIYDWKN